MQRIQLALACCLLAAAATAHAQPAPDGAPVQPLGGDGSGSAAPIGDAPVVPPADPTTTPPPADPAPPPQPPPPPTPPPPQPTPPPPPPQQQAPAPERPTPPRCKTDSDSYYSCERGFGIFHSSRLTAGAMTATVPTITTDPMTGATSAMDKKVTSGVVAFEGSFLPIPSSFSPANFHGLEFSTGIRTEKFDFWLSFGTSVTVLNLGHGGAGTLRLGGGFGAGFDLAHGFAYLRGRGAIVLAPEHMDLEVSTQWTPGSASTDNYDTRFTRVSVWYRLSGGRKAIEVYAAKLERVDPTAPMDDRALKGGNELGVGMSLF